MTRAARTSLALCAALALVLPLTAWVRLTKAKIEGPPSRPTFVFRTRSVLANFTVLRWNGEKWTNVWGIENDHTTDGFVRQVEYGVVPKGFSEYVPLKLAALATNSLYMIYFEGGAVRGGGVFAIVDRSGKPTVVEIDGGRPIKDIVAEFERLVHRP
jgi:hypothetical protein